MKNKVQNKKMALTELHVEDFRRVLQQCFLLWKLETLFAEGDRFGSDDA